MISKEQRIKDFLGLKLKDAKNDQLQLKKLKTEVNGEGYDALVQYSQSLDNHVNTLETLLNK